MDWFDQPWALVMLPLMLAAWAAVSRGRSGIAALEQDRWPRFALRFGALVLLAFAAAGLRWPGGEQPVQAVLALDVSDSIHDRAAQEALARDAARFVRDAGGDLGVVIFGRQPGLERKLSPVPIEPRGREAGTENAALVSLSQPRSIVDGGASDYGAALDFSRGLFGSETTSARAVVLIGDGLDTEGKAESAAAGLRAQGVALLVRPASLPETRDVYLSGVRMPERGKLGRLAPVEASVRGPPGVSVRVRLYRRIGNQLRPVDEAEGKLAAPEGAKEGRLSVTLHDKPDAPGVYAYVIEASGPGQGDVEKNNRLEAALRIDAPSRWAVLARPGSALAQWAAAAARPLGVETMLFAPGALPTQASDYRGFTGALIDGLGEDALKNGSPPLNALREASRNGLGIVAVGGDSAFGAGGHPADGDFARLLPVTFRPEDDRARAVLFLIDVSESMRDPMSGGSKMFFAQNVLSQAARSLLRPTDRVGLVAFSGDAKVACALAPGPDREAFLGALKSLTIDAKTDILAALTKAKELLDQDSSEERLVILLSDGEQTVSVENRQQRFKQAAEALCPPDQLGPGSPKRRTRLFSFGIDVGGGAEGSEGAKLMKDLAHWGGGAYFPNFEQLEKTLKDVIEENEGKELFMRRGPFSVRASSPHEILSAGGARWPVLEFRNRVKARPGRETLFSSAPLNEANAARGKLPDPLIVLGQNGPARCAVLALSLDGNDGRAFLSSGTEWKGGASVLARMLAWAEAREDERAGWNVSADASGDKRMRVMLEATQPESRDPLNGLNIVARVSRVTNDADAPREPTSAQLLPVAPGHYEADVPVDAEGVYRLELMEESASGETSAGVERFVTVPFPPEYRRFGTDRLALQKLVDLAGGRSRMLNTAHDFKDWLSVAAHGEERVSARPALLVLAALLILAELALRTRRRSA